MEASKRKELINDMILFVMLLILLYITILGWLLVYYVIPTVG